MRSYQAYTTLTKNSPSRGILYCLLFFLHFFLQGCFFFSPQRSNDFISQEDKTWMEPFFHEFFLGGSTIYTLFGTKPIAGKIVTEATKKDFEESVHYYLEREKIEGKERKKILREMSSSFQEDTLLKSWNKWICFIKKYPNSPFLFAKHPTLSKKLWIIHILNIQETIWVLQKHYDLFQREVGYDFDPISATLEFTNIDSPFWKKVFSNHLLSGIVYGYGYRNSYFFSLLQKEFSYDLAKKEAIFSSKILPFSKEKTCYSIPRLPLPRFRSFRLPYNEDPILERYKLERKKIQKNLNEKNFFQKILFQILGTSSEKEKPLS